ncbi:MAG TPA: 16S rRNA (cytosine(1402)-N(4))-methyltransferase RsmH [Bacillota bacterium]|nr:16S rRNA (cytosine(1402)-N(4))-methyltransferase RsmH [Bacillota bacterium]
MPEFRHQTVLREEAVQALNIRPGGIYVDATLGGSGHALKIANAMDETGLLIGIDQDQLAIATARERLDTVKPRVELFRRNFMELQWILNELRIEQIDGILFDLGVSSPQLDEEERGFSYKNDAPLDMRMDQSQAFSAAHLVNTASVEELARIIWNYGEERWSKRIAQFIERQRRDKPIETTGELTEIIKQAIPAAARKNGPHPARRTFQALRIAVNHELEVLEKTLEQVVQLLKPEGRVAVISFHSLEDRIVKNTFARWSKGCVCPRDFPVCQCGKTPLLEIITRKPLVPSKEELLENPRARSAKLRVAERRV